MRSLADLFTPNSPKRRSVQPVRRESDLDASCFFVEDAMTLEDALAARKPGEDERASHDVR